MNRGPNAAAESRARDAVSNPYTVPEFASAALVTIDTQRDVLDGGGFSIPGTSAALPAMRHLADGFREARRPIVHIVRIYEQDGSNAEPCRRQLLTGGAQLVIRGTQGCQLATELLPDPGARLDRGAVAQRWCEDARYA